VGVGRGGEAPPPTRAGRVGTKPGHLRDRRRRHEASGGLVVSLVGKSRIGMAAKAGLGRRTELGARLSTRTIAWHEETGRPRCSRHCVHPYATARLPASAEGLHALRAAAFEPLWVGLGSVTLRDAASITAQSRGPRGRSSDSKTVSPDPGVKIERGVTPAPPAPPRRSRRQGPATLLMRAWDDEEVSSPDKPPRDW